MEKKRDPTRTRRRKGITGGGFPPGAHTRLVATSLYGRVTFGSLLAMRAIALVPLLIALTPRGPHGSIGDTSASRAFLTRSTRAFQPWQGSATQKMTPFASSGTTRDKGMWRGSVERVSRSPERCGLIEARVRTQIRYLHIPRSRRRARAEHHNLMFRSNSVTDGGPTAVAAATLVAD